MISTFLWSRLLATLWLPALPAGAAPGAPPPVVHEPARVGVVDTTTSFVALDQGAAGWQGFHLGTGHTAWSPVIPLAGDPSGDGRDTVGLYVVRGSRFLLFAENAVGPQRWVVPFGDPNAPVGDAGIPVDPLLGNWDWTPGGEGAAANPEDTVGLYDRRCNRFALRNTNAPGRPHVSFAFGAGNVQGIAGDWDGDGRDTVGVYDAATGVARLAARNAADAPERELHDLPRGRAVVADWDGDGADEIAVYVADERAFRIPDAAAPSGWRTVGVDIVGPVAAPVGGLWHHRPETGESTGYPWETATPEEVGLDPELLRTGVAAARGIENLHSLLVVRGGRLASETYLRGYTAGRAQNVKSVSKSVLSALVGIATGQGRIRGAEQPVADVLPGYFAVPDRPTLSQITFGHLLTMRAGLDWTEPGLGPWIASDDWVGYVAAQPFAEAPGEAWRYSTGLTHVGASALGHVVPGPLSDYAAVHLYEPLGIAPTRWDLDPAARHLGGAEVWLRPRDMARFGELYLREGTLDGQVIVPAEWVRSTTRPLTHAYGRFDYGGWWWSSRFDSRDVYFAWGHGGQFIFVVPELDMVVVATSKWWVPAAEGTHNEVFDLLERFILPAATGRYDVHAAPR